MRDGVGFLAQSKEPEGDDWSNRTVCWVVTALHVVFQVKRASFDDRRLPQRNPYVWVPLPRKVLQGTADEPVSWIHWSVGDGHALFSEDNDCIAFPLQRQLSQLSYNVIPMSYGVNCAAGAQLAICCFRRLWSPDAPEKRTCTVRNGISDGLMDEDYPSFTSSLLADSGDSGAPIFVYRSEEWVLAGLHVGKARFNVVARVEDYGVATHLSVKGIEDAFRQKPLKDQGIDLNYVKFPATVDEIRILKGDLKRLQDDLNSLKTIVEGQDERLQEIENRSSVSARAIADDDEGESNTKKLRMATTDNNQEEGDH